MENKKDSPRVYIPPPLFYVAAFLGAVFIQKLIPIDNTLFSQQWMKIVGAFFLVTALFFLSFSLFQFLQSKNTVVTILPANSLQTTGIFGLTRNPMYIGLAFIYLGLSCLIGNWWNMILFPVLLLFVQEYIIKREEKYLHRRFGPEYEAYRKRVRRWL
jgi:protein-S-isoprenylcysteine O-methyltransferase Ste14